MRRSAAVVATLLLAASTPTRAAARDDDGFDARVRSALGRELACVNLSVEDLGWNKRPVDDAFRLSCVNETLDRPFALAERAMRAEHEFAGDPSASARAAAAWLDVTAAEPRRAVIAEPAAARDAAAGARPLLALLVAAERQARSLREDAISALTPSERKLVEGEAPGLYASESEEERDLAPMLAALRKVDLGKLVAAEIVLADAASSARELAAGLDASMWRSGTWTIDGVAVEVGGPGPDAHDARIVVDGGGDDTYAAGCALVVDLAGDDTYRGVGSGLMDVGLTVDLGGDDRYLGADFAQGSACVGAALLLDVSGNDRYEAGQCSQGSGVAGVGLLMDLAGDDEYRGARFVQGFGGVMGLGALSDVAGNDSYHAGGKFKHEPLLPNSFQSLSQGFGFGLRPDASGGVGILADHAGNDTYAAEVFGQGASYWYSLGILADSAGNDGYQLYQYGQGAGIHLSAGVLMDRAGDDAYSCLNGVAQGSGHDWGVGLLWDRGGNDGYQGSGMSQGGANANAIGMIVDEAGNDSYAGWNERNQGDSFPSRGSIGLGVLLDLAGQDRYTHGGKDGATWTRGSVGVGMDVPAEPKP